MSDNKLTRARSKSTDVFATLYERITSSRYLPNSKLASENSLALEFKVSVATVRTAIDELIFRGLVYRRKGVGSFVSSKINIPNLLNEDIEWSDLIEAGGYKVGIQYRQSRIVDAQKHQIEQLQLEDDRRLYEMQKTFTADGQPVIVVTDVVPAVFFTCADLEAALKDPAITEPYLPFLHRATGIQPATVLASIRVTTVADCGLSEFAPEEPILAIDGVIYSSDEIPLACGVAYYPGNFMNFNIRRTLKPNATV
jgi:DNA-binding GntR family transcriptional regulator